MLPLRVLVAEDNAFNAQLLRQLLASRGAVPARLISPDVLLAAFSTSAATIASEFEDAAVAGDLDAAARLVQQLAAITPRLLAAVASTSIDSLTADPVGQRA